MDRKIITLNTAKQFTRLNEILEDFVKEKQGIGLLHVFTQHTTCAVKIIENELLLLADINDFLDTLCPKDKKYKHDIIEIREVPSEERVNGFSHLRQLMLPTSETIPVQDGKLLLGKWQTVFLVELDPVRDRDIVITYLSTNNNTQ